MPQNLNFKVIKCPTKMEDSEQLPTNPNINNNSNPPPNPNPMHNSGFQNEMLYNIWTVRLTFPTLFQDEYTVCMNKMFDSIEKTKQVKYSMTFKEYSKKKVLHYHMRIVTTYKTPEMLRKYIKSFFPKEAKGQRFFSTHKVWVNGVLHDQSLCHSATYIAKEGHIVHRYGYTDYQISELIKESKKYNKMLNMPVHEKVIQIYDITQPNQIIKAVSDFYESIEKIPPKRHIMEELIRKILYKVSSDFRKNYWASLDQYLFEQITPYS